MDDGHSRGRRVWQQQVNGLQLLWRFTWAEYAIWDAFLRYDVENGAIEFDMKLVEGGPFYTIRLSSPPTEAYQAATNTWDVTAPVESVIPAPTASAPAALPSWPASLPQPEKDSYSITRPNAFARGSIAEGYPGQRSRQREVIGVVSMLWLLDPDQYLQAKEFINNDLFGGMLPFEGWFANSVGPEQRVRMTFLDNPKFSPNGAWFTLTGTVEVRDMPVISKLEYTGNKQQILDEVSTGDKVFVKYNAYANDYVDWGYTSDTKQLA